MKQAERPHFLAKRRNVLRGKMFAEELLVASHRQAPDLRVADVRSELVHELTPTHVDI